MRLIVRNAGVAGPDDSVLSRSCITGALPASMSFARMMPAQNDPQNVTVRPTRGSRDPQVVEQRHRR